jgi:phosphoglycerate dehydrogenase-like enzyme
MSKIYTTRRAFLSGVAAASGSLALTGFSPFPELEIGEQAERPFNSSREIRILSLQKFEAKHIERIRAVSSNISFNAANAPSADELSNAEVIIGDPDSKMLQQAKNLKWVQVMHAGVENMPREMITHPLVLTNMQKVLAPVIAETAIALLLSLTRGLTQFAFPNFQQKKWVYNPPPDIVLEDLYKKTIGIVGMGGIGSETARRLHYGFNMQVLGTDPKPMHKPEYVEDLRDPSWFMEMVPKVDVLMSAAPLTKETKEMFNAKVFAAMKPTSYFINVSRGGLVDQKALVDALKSKRIRAAGLDVATPEPLPADDPLWTCPNVAITAHNSSNAAVRTDRVMGLLVENIRRYSLGLPLMNVVDKEKGY